MSQAKAQNTVETTRPSAPANAGAVDYTMANGISDLSLRPLATALGTQTPVLLHHFGTKDHLVVEAARG